MSIVAGADFGTQSVRFSIFDSHRGRLGAAVCTYPLHRRKDDPDFATQSHCDHLAALITAAQQAIADAGIDGHRVQALAVDTTGSTVVPVDEHLQPLCDYYLWCDHRAWREAEAITRAAHQAQLEAIDWAGGTYSSEWGFAKLWHWMRNNPAQRNRMVTAVEHCDLITAVLCGITEPDKLPRSICAMGHKWMWNASLGGLPSDSFLTGLDPLLSGVRDKITGNFATSDTIAGHLSPEWAEKLGLQEGIPLPTGALDAHWDAIGAGIRLGDIVNVIGTSTCVMAISDHLTLIPGVCGIVAGSIHPAYAGIEAGIAAAGDVFDAIARRAGRPLADLSKAIDGFRVGQTGLLRLPWDNGDRSVLSNPQLSGITLGWNLNHRAEDELFAAIEGTAFQTRIILERMAAHGTSIQRVINAGGIPRRSSVVNQVYADVLDKPILVPEIDSTSLGSAIFAFLAAGAFKTVEEAQQALCPPYHTIEPDPRGASTADQLYSHFRTVYFSMGTSDAPASPLSSILPQLRRIAAGVARPTPPAF